MAASSTDRLGRRRNHADPDGWDTLRRFANLREAVEEVIEWAEDSTDPLVIAIRLRLARA